LRNAWPCSATWNTCVVSDAWRGGTAALEPRPEPTLEDVRREYEPAAVEVTELVGLCLWDIFSDNHDVIADDGRLANIGSFRGAGALLDEHPHATRRVGRTAITCGSTWERSGFPEVPS
jgi:hypothetical protein